MIDTPTFYITKEVDQKIKAIGDKVGHNEFLSYIMVKPDQINLWIDICIPDQEVTSGTVDIPQVEGRNDYEKRFSEALTNKDPLIPIGTFHKHPIDGWSGTDDHDITNQAIIALNAGLPFIDIFWNGKTNGEYNGRMATTITTGTKALTKFGIPTQKTTAIIPIKVQVLEYNNLEEQEQYNNLINTLTETIITKAQNYTIKIKELTQALQDTITPPEPELANFNIEELDAKIKRKTYTTQWDKWDKNTNNKNETYCITNDCDIKIEDNKKHKILNVIIQDYTLAGLYANNLTEILQTQTNCKIQLTKTGKTIIKIPYETEQEKQEIKNLIQEAQETTKELEEEIKEEENSWYYNDNPYKQHRYLDETY